MLAMRLVFPKYAMPMNFLDLFAGCGGLSEGFIREGFRPIAHVESDAAACNSLRTRVAYRHEATRDDAYHEYLDGKISREELYSLLPARAKDSIICEEISKLTRTRIFNQIDTLLEGKKIDVVIGGPPCQAYSQLGRATSPNRMVGDDRNYLYLHYIEFLKTYQPKYFVFENVRGMLSAKNRDGSNIFDQMISGFQEAGYKVVSEVLNAFDYSVPQHRKRVIVIGKHTKDDFEFPTMAKSESLVSINQLFADLPAIDQGEGNINSERRTKKPHANLHALGITQNTDDSRPITFHNARTQCARDLTIYRRVVEHWLSTKTRIRYSDLDSTLITHKTTDRFLDRFKHVVGEHQGSHTVMAHIAKDGHYYIHPDITQNRSLTPREAARLQTFPDDFVFESNTPFKRRTSAYRQIGNAVPVLLAQKIAQSLQGIMNNG